MTNRCSEATAALRQRFCSDVPEVSPQTLVAAEQDPGLLRHGPRPGGDDDGVGLDLQPALNRPRVIYLCSPPPNLRGRLAASLLWLDAVLFHFQLFISLLLAFPFSLIFFISFCLHIFTCFFFYFRSLLGAIKVFARIAGVSGS